MRFELAEKDVLHTRLFATPLYNTQRMEYPFPAYCEIHLVPIVNGAGCRYCLRFLRNAPDPFEMPPGARSDELEQWLVMAHAVDSELIYRRIEDLLGRPVGLEELEYPDELLQEVQRPLRPRVRRRL